MLSGSPTSKEVQGTWYKSLKFPPGRVPDQVFPVMWAILYTGMGYASYVALKSYDSATISETAASNISKGLAIYYGQLALNCGWSSLFFVKKRVGLALLDSIAITASSACMTVLFHKATDGATTYFLAPYCAWLCYATYINASVWYLNRGRKVTGED
ncbi:unnamed protein product [Somion occarium]